MRPLLVLGLDGATFDVIRPLAAAGRLPNLCEWMQRGTALPLRSSVPPMTFPAWSSFLTGLDPGRHGLFDFTQKVAGAYRVRFNNATDRHGASLFARIRRAGGCVLALGMPATFPPEPVSGLLVPGFDAPVSVGSDPGSSSDASLYREIAARVGPWMRPDLGESAAEPGWHERALPTLLARIRRKTDFALEAVARLRAQGRAPDLGCVVFSESDTVAHHFWRDYDAASPRHDPRAGSARRSALASVYEALDAACGEIRQAFGPEAGCVVISDHGSGGASRRVVHLNRYLEECGFLRRAPAPRARLARSARALRDLALRELPPGLAQAMFRRTRPAAARLESAVRFGGFDWRRTAAFSEESNTQPGVWINLTGREAEGCVEPRDYERVRSEVIQALLGWTLPGGSRVVERARPRESVYRGRFVERAPDVVVELALEHGYAHSLVTTPWEREGVGSVRSLEEHELAGGRGRGMNGTHRPDGILISQPALACGAAPERAASIVDVAPTLLAAMGIEWEDRPDGESPLPARRYQAEEEDLVAARLRALGYLE